MKYDFVRETTACFTGHRALKNDVLVLLRHASHNGDDRARLLRLPMLQPAKGAVNFLFGVFAHATGVKENQIGVLTRCKALPTCGNQSRRRKLRIQDVHLTPDRFNVKFHFSSSLAVFDSIENVDAQPAVGQRL